jgi:hypothetical protein
MSLYKADIYHKGHDDTRYRYQHFWDVGKMMMFASALNLTNTKYRCHRALPLDELDYYIVVSPYFEEYYNNGYKSGYQQVYPHDKIAYVCKVMR